MKKVILSGIQPTGNLTLGNYIGALKNWVDLQEEYKCYYMLADLHTLTKRNDPEELRNRSLELLALYIAARTRPRKKYNICSITCACSCRTRMDFRLLYIYRRII